LNHYPLKSQNTEEEYWLALVRAPGVGPVKFAALLKHFETPRQLFEADPSEWDARKIIDRLRNYLQNPDWNAVEKDLKWLAQANHHLLTRHHPDYPPLLREIHNAPPILFIHGDPALLSTKQLAIVGTRHPSSEGEKTAREFAEYLSHQGFTITSGMALGIDGASHWGALTGTGKTIAVAGTGLDRVYPPQHRELAYKIAETGALVSEFLPGTPVRRDNFPLRNRIVSALSLATLVIEAPEGSGALYTATNAIKQGRELFVIPGSIYNPLMKGSHQLIKDGAKLVDTAAEILEKLQISPNPSLAPTNLQSPTDSPHSSTDSQSTTVLPSKHSSTESSTIEKPALPSDLGEDYIRLLNYLGTGTTSIDNLVEQSNLTAGEVSSMLLILELRGLVAVQSGGFYARTS
jgi:DNA processing protein